MSDKTYKCASPKAVCNKIWQADFNLGSFNHLVESKDSESVVATVGLSEYGGPDKRISLVATLHDHAWSEEVFRCLLETIVDNEETLNEWSVAKGASTWTVTMKWRD